MGQHRRTGQRSQFIVAALLAAAIGAGCASAPAPASAPAAAPPKAAAAAKVDYAAILAAPGRPEVDRKDDEARKPAELLAFMGVHPGQTVLELEAGRGYFTELLSSAVGPTGKVIMQGPPEFANYADAVKARLANNRLANVTKSTTHFDALEPKDKSVDLVVWVLGPHELYYTPKGASLGDAAKSYAEIFRVLKPGGQFVAIDHAAAAGAPTTTGNTIHRIDPAVVLASAQKAGFTLAAKSDLLANPSDDRSKMVFDPSIRRHTDQFIFQFVKK